MYRHLLAEHKKAADTENAEENRNPEQRRVPDMSIDADSSHDPVEYRLQDYAHKKGKKKRWYKCVEQGKFTRHWAFLLTQLAMKR